MDQIKLIRYLSDECSESERDEIEYWLESDPVNRKEIKELKQIWRESKNSLIVDNELFDVEDDWHQLSTRIERQSNKAGMYQLSGLDSVNRNQRFVPIFRIVAILVLVALMGVFISTSIFITDSASVEESVMREIRTDLGQRSSIVLSDGTNLTVNAGSRLLVPQKFEATHREVYLIEGEAYFEVATDEHRPFLIHTGDTVIRVLGTSFSIRTYPEDNHIRVFVNSGLVQFGTESQYNDGLLLGAMEMGEYQNESGQLTRSVIQDKDIYFGWIQGYLKFHETPLKQVLKEIERRYNVPLEVSQDIQDLLLTATLKGREIQNVLDVIASALEIEYDNTDNGKIVFTPGNEPVLHK